MRFYKKLCIFLSFIFNLAIFPKEILFDKYMQNSDERNIVYDINNVIRKIEK